MSKKEPSNRNKSRLIRQLQRNAGYSTEEMAKLLGYSKTYFNNKLYRNSFSFEDIVTATTACGYTITFEPKYEGQCIILVDPRVFVDKRTVIDLVNYRKEKKSRSKNTILLKMNFKR